jgi:hypothetical protein
MPTSPLAKESFMKAIAILPLLLLGFCAFTNGGEKKKSDSIKFDMNYLEKKWGIKYKSHAVEDIVDEKAKVKVKVLRILLEFTKDVDNLKEMQRAFTSNPRLTEKGDTPIYLWFVFFDEDNVSLGKLYPMRLEGDLSGKKGDAFRLFFNPIPAILEKVRKIEARPGDAEKDKSSSPDK